MERIYADNAGTTPMAAEVIETMTEMMKNVFGNASAVSSFGREARRVLDESRHVIAESINAKSDNEIVFTSGGTESDNTAIMQTAFLRRNEGRHIITTAIEHEAVLKPMAFLESQGYESEAGSPFMKSAKSFRSRMHGFIQIACRPTEFWMWTFKKTR